MPAEKRLDQIAIKVNGNDLPHELMDVLLEVEVDSSLYLPDMVIMAFHDDDLRWMDEDFFALGATVEVEMAMDEDRTERVFSGEITAIEPHFSANLTATLVVRGYDPTHRLNRGTKSRAFVQVTDNDIVEQVAREAGLQVRAENTTDVYDHVFQHNQTDLEFLQARANRIGFEISVDERTVHFRQPHAGGDNPVELSWGDTLRSFTPRLTIAGQVNEVIVKGWDPLTKREIMGKATSSETAPEINVGGQGGTVAAGVFSAAKQLIVREPVASQSEADRVAQAILDEINAGFVEAEGVAIGNPKLAAGKPVKLSSLGQRFSGTYMMTSTNHLYSAKGGYETRFRVEGARPSLMADLVQDASPAAQGGGLWGGVVPAVVTNNNDERNMGRVKVKFPWLDSSLESDWARVAAVGAGNEIGLMWLPEVNDEVLVAFEHGDFNHPYIIGSLWNGEDAPPESISNVIKAGKVQRRTFKTRAGHIIRLSDDDSEKYIEIIDSAQGTRIKLDANSQTLTIDTQKDIKLKATSNINLEATGNIDIKASGQLTLKGAMVNIN